jgi:hypothetical protein
MAALRYGTKAWLGLAAYLAVVEALAPQGETLSERVDDWLVRHPGKALVHLLVGATALHLINALSPKIDPIHILFTVVKPSNVTTTERHRL